MKFTSKAAALVALGFGAVAADAATPIVDGNGILTGATGVTMGSDVYDVSFADGTCAQAYGTCAASSFAFSDATNARAAAQALLDQVFTGVYDTNPEKTFGCLAIGLCRTLITYGTTDTDFLAAYSMNRNNSSVDAVTTVSLALDFDTSTNESVNFAVFTKEAAAVPEPASWAMFIGGFGLIGGAARRKRAAVRFA